MRRLVHVLIVLSLAESHAAAETTAAVENAIPSESGASRFGPTKG